MVDEITNEDLERMLHASAAANPALRRQFLNAVAAWRALEGEKITWSESYQKPDGAWVLAYPQYPDELYNVYGLLGQLTKPLPATGLGERQDPATASLGYLIRGVLVTFRTERFSDGAIAAAVDSGTMDLAFDRIVAALS